MRNWFAHLLPTASLRIGIDRHAITVQRIEPRWRRSAMTMLAESPSGENESWSLEATAIRLRTLLTEAQCNSMRARIELGDDLVRYFTVTPPRNAHNLADCRAAVAMRFHALYGDTPGAWRIEADWQANTPFVACAVPADLAKMLVSVLNEKHLTPIELVPQFVAAWNRWRPQLKSDAWFGLVRTSGVTIGVIRQGQLHAVRSLAQPDDADGSLAWLPKQLQREALLLGAAAPTRLQLTGHVPAEDVVGAWEGLVCERLDRIPARKTADSTGITLAKTGGRA